MTPGRKQEVKMEFTDSQMSQVHILFTAEHRKTKKNELESIIA